MELFYFCLAALAVWVMYWVVQAADLFRQINDSLDAQSEREAAFLARHVNEPLPGGASPHGDASVRPPSPRELIPLTPGVDHRASPPPSAKPVSNVVSMDAWGASHAR